MDANDKEFLNSIKDSAESTIMLLGAMKDVRLSSFHAEKTKELYFKGVEKGLLVNKEVIRLIDIALTKIELDHAH